jgi:hypothetical protein
MCSLHEQFGVVWPNTATNSSKSGQDWQLLFLRMAFPSAITSGTCGNNVDGDCGLVFACCLAVFSVIKT